MSPQTACLSYHVIVTLLDPKVPEIAELGRKLAAAAEAALAGLPESDALAALRGLARYAVQRTH